MNFQKLKTTIAGNLGEAYIPQFCKAKNLKCYQPSWNDSFPVDSIMLDNKNKVYALEIKTKPKMLYYDRTGFDYVDYLTYLDFDIPVYILFVDYIAKKIYGNWLTKLKNNVIIDGKYVYFELKHMITYKELNEDEVLQLKNASNNTYYK